MPVSWTMSETGMEFVSGWSGWVAEYLGTRVAVLGWRFSIPDAGTRRRSMCINHR